MGSGDRRMPITRRRSTARRVFECRNALAALLVLAGSATLLSVPRAQAAPADPESCRAVRLSDIGWTAESVATAVLARLLADLGYQPQVTVLSVPVTFEALKNGDMDIFIGNWLPAQTPILQPFLDEHSIDMVRTNLVGAKYTLAVPDYLHDAGLRDFADINRFREQLGGSIYGIEPGNDGNQLILGMIKRNDFGLGGFKLVESSEQGMLAEVERAVSRQRPIVFLAWAPHPMNTHFRISYLTGGDSTFGPDFGAATVHTLSRPGYVTQCPNVGRLLRNFELNVDLENEWMDAVLNRKISTLDVAQQWVESRPELMMKWLVGVRTFDGGKPYEQAPVHLRSGPESAFESWVMSRRIPVGDAATRFVDYTKLHAKGFFEGVSAFVRVSTNAVGYVLTAAPAVVLIGAIALLAWFLRRSIPLVVFVIVSLLFIMNQGYWDATIETLTLVLVAALVATAIGVPLGIAAARRPRLQAALRPILDLMQTLPTFVYLTPTLVLFGLGVVPGLVSTVIFALPAPIRLTQVGISSVPKPLIEAGQAFGATPLQLLLKVELPSAAPMILAGVTQCIMLSLSMVVIAALVGAGGLGVPVVRALNTVQVGMGFEAGIAIVLVAIILDRISRPAESKGAG
jgi:glycine betaine/proline transport system substrate-binding protein